MSWAVFMVCFLYIGCLALYGQSVLLGKLFDWLDPKMKRWLERRRDA